MREEDDVSDRDREQMQAFLCRECKRALSKIAPKVHICENPACSWFVKRDSLVSEPPAATDLVRRLKDMLDTLICDPDIRATLRTDFVTDAEAATADADAWLKRGGE
jgi:ribosomal protein L37AE/L43A